MKTRRRIAVLVLVVAGMLVPAIFTSVAWSALPRTYQVQRVDSPAPTPNGTFGFGFTSAGDLDRDGKEDILSSQGTNLLNDGANPTNGTLFVMSGATGGEIMRIPAPEPEATPTAADRAAAFSLYHGRFADIGSCTGGTPGAICATPIGAKDAVPEILASAIFVDVPTAGAPGGEAVDIGRVYVLDGRTGAVLKRLDMPPADRAAQRNVSAAQLGPIRPFFGRTVLWPSGVPVCQGNGGLSACPGNPTAVANGDLDGGGQPDVVVGASGYYEDSTSYPSRCTGATNTCRASGRTYIFNGEDFATNTSAAQIIETPTVLQNPLAQIDDANTNVNVSELFGHAVAPVGDVGRCMTAGPAGSFCPAAESTITPDGRPDVLVSAFRVDYPVNSPDSSLFDIGVNFLIDGTTKRVLNTYVHPEPQAGSIFGFMLQTGPPVGDLGGTTAPDLYLPADGQNDQYRGQGRGYVMNGNFKASPNLINLATLNDPTPQASENFGTGSTGLGDVAGLELGLDARGEMLVGAFGPHNPNTNERVVNDASIFSPLTERPLQTLAAPDQQEGAGFGADMAALGDLNDDGFVDFAIGAGYYDDVGGINQGRIYIFRSDNSPAPPGPSPPAPPAGPQGPIGPAGPVGPAAGTSTVAVSRAGRSLELVASDSRVAAGRRVRLAGALEAFADPAGCERGQSVALQRRSAKSVRYKTFARVRTDASGSFSQRLRPGKTYVYRARVEETGKCLGATSNRERVDVAKKRKSRR